MCYASEKINYRKQRYDLFDTKHLKHNKGKKIFYKSVSSKININITINF